jgi:hypothetical protein
MTEHDRLSRTPIPVVDLDAILCIDDRHGFFLSGIYAGELRRSHLLCQPLSELEISVTAAAPAHAVAV